MIADVGIASPGAVLIVPVNVAPSWYLFKSAIGSALLSGPNSANRSLGVVLTGPPAAAAGFSAAGFSAVAPAPAAAPASSFFLQAGMMERARTRTSRLRMGATL